MSNEDGKEVIAVTLERMAAQIRSGAVVVDECNQEAGYIRAHTGTGRSYTMKPNGKFVLKLEYHLDPKG